MIKSNHFLSTLLRSCAVFLRHAGNALAALAIARSTSLALNAGTVVMVFCVAGFETVMVSPELAACHFPSNQQVERTKRCAVAESCAMLVSGSACVALFINSIPLLLAERHY